MKNKKMYLVKREVMAIDIEHALKAPGKIYEIQLVADNLQPIPTSKKSVGFK